MGLRKGQIGRNLSGDGPTGTLDGVRLVPAVPGDLAALCALDAACFGLEAWSPGSWREVLTEPGWMVLTARADTALAGALVLLPWPPVASLASVAVAPPWRRRGLGRRLLLEALHRGRACGARWLSLEVDADNADALRLYRREGFRAARRFVESGRHRLEMLHRLGGPHE